MMIRRSWFNALALLLLCLPPARAQNLADYDYENLALRGVGFDFGFIWPNRVDATAALSMRVDLGYLGPGVRITPVLSYWNSTFKREELVRLAQQLSRLPGVTIEPEQLGTIEWTDIAAGFDAHVVWTTPYRVSAYAGGGVALHVLNGSGPIVQDNLFEDLLDTVTAGGAAMLGAELQLIPQLRVYGEVRYTLLDDVRYPGVRVGAALMFPRPPATTGTPAPR